MYYGQNKWVNSVYFNIYYYYTLTYIFIAIALINKHVIYTNILENIKWNKM